MRYTKKPEPKDGETRVIERFLWLPVTIGKEVRWLERASIKQTRWSYRDLYGFRVYKWANSYFLD